MNNFFKKFSEKQQLILKHQITTFSITFFAYAAVHATRTSWSSSKESLKNQMHEQDDKFLGLVDTSFLLCYAFSMQIQGALTKNILLQYALGLGMISASVAFLIIYFVCQITLNKPFILFMMIINGISQSTAWPSVVASMGNWFGKGKKGLLMGIWATQGNFGNMIGYFIQNMAVNKMQLDWKYSLFFSGMFLLILGVICVLYLEPYPQKFGISQQDLQNLSEKLENPNLQNQSQNISQQKQQQQQPQIQCNNDNYNVEIQSNQIDKQNQIMKEPLNANNYEFQIEEKNKETIKIDANQQRQQKKDDFDIFHDEEDHQNKEQQEQEEKNNEIDQQEINHEDIQKNNQEIVQNLEMVKPIQNDQNNDQQKNNELTQKQELQDEADNINYFNAWIKIPGLAIYAIAMGGVKGTIYGIIFWLPIYLQKNDMKQQAVIICSMNEIGTFAGGVLLGYLVDKYQKRAFIITIFIFLSFIDMIILYNIPSGTPGPYYFLVLFAGILLGGPYNMIGGSVAIDLVEQSGFQNNKNLLALVTAIIDSTGSISGAFIQTLISFFGYQQIFAIFIVTTGLSSFVLIKKAKKEIYQ